MASTENYRQTQIMTASPIQLVLMLYNECIRALNQAEESFAIEGPARFENVSKNLLRAQDVIAELVVSLDMELGGDIAANLHRLYDFMITHLSEANTKKQMKPVQDVRDLMSDLREAWQQVAEQESEHTPDSHHAPPPGNSIMFSG